MSLWKDCFAGYATETAFSLQLGKWQCAVLASVANGDWIGYGRSNTRALFLNSTVALERKGLIERNEKAFGSGHKGTWHFRLTPAGQAVLQLLEMAGVVSVASPDARAA